MVTSLVPSEIIFRTWVPKILIFTTIRLILVVTILTELFILTLTGHVQIAQVPDRHEPDTAGEIDYRYIFSLLDKEGYNDYIGLEYRPAAGSAEGLKWIKNFGYTL